jgi:pimeloyl-ACP methyl ester carboxylesterase
MMIRRSTPTWREIAAIVMALALPGTVFLLWDGCSPRPENQRVGKFPEELVSVRSKDDIVSGGAIFSPPKDSAKPIAVIWIHGWGVNFYSPTYVGIGRALVERGYPCITANTRMHDLGNIAAWRGTKRIRGGGYWGVASEEVRDLAAWIDFAETRGFNKVVLVGHSAGWAAVRRYQADKQDERVVGVVLASGAVRAETRPTDPEQLAEATRLIGKGEGDALVRDLKRSFPSYVSAATLLDSANAPPEFKDFFGVQTTNAAVTRMHCPLLAFFGTRGDVGTEADLELLKSSIKRQSRGPRRVDTVMIQHADHMYTGEEAQVAQTIAKWADTLVPPEAVKSDPQEKR